MPQWTKLKDKAIFAVKNYAPPVLVLTMLFDETEADAFDWGFTAVQNQEKFLKQLGGLARDAFQSAFDRGAKAAINAGETLVDTAGSAVQVLEDYALDYIRPFGIWIPDVPPGWNPFRADDDTETEDLYMYKQIDLHYKYLNDPRMYEPTPDYEQKTYGGHKYFLPPLPEPGLALDATLTLYHQLGGEDLDGEFLDDEGKAYCIRWVNPGFLSFLQQMPLDLLEQLYYHGGWPYTIIGASIWDLFDGSPSHPNYTTPPGADPTSCFVGKYLEGHDAYLGVTDNNPQEYCVNWGCRTYNSHVDLWKRAFWWAYIMGQHNPPMGIVQSGGYTGADYALLQFSGKEIPDDPIIYDGPTGGDDEDGRTPEAMPWP